jgi:hypothetical protein
VSQVITAPGLRALGFSSAMGWRLPWPGTSKRSRVSAGAGG